MTSYYVTVSIKLYPQAGFSFIVRLQGPRNSFQSAGAGDHLFWSGGGGGMVEGEGGGGPVTTSFEVVVVVVVEGEGKGQIWLFSLFGCLELLDYWTFLDSLLSGVVLINFKPLKSTFLHAESTTRSLQIMILNVGSCNPFILSSVSSKCVRDHIISRYNSF